ncbi:MAG: hypothetical protein K6E73_10765 [Bacteroidales bacterium]|nr:hypothetical protein [Bacteroidales bacterium]
MAVEDKTPAWISGYDPSANKEQWMNDHMAGGNKLPTDGATPAKEDDYALAERKASEQHDARMKFLSEMARQYQPETAEQAKKRQKNEKAQALMDGIGGAMTGLANMVGGISGGYAFPEGEKPKEEDPIEKARKERLERAKRYYEARKGQLDEIESYNDKIQAIRRLKKQDEAAAAKAETEAAYARNKDARAQTAADDAHALNEAKINETNAQAGYYNRGRAGRSSTTRVSGGAGRSGKIDMSLEDPIEPDE